MEPWAADEPGVLVLPSGRRVWGRALRQVPNGPDPTFGVYLGGRPPLVPWDSRWVRWRDFSLPADPAELREALRDALAHAVDGRVEVACRGGTGRTGTALACLAVLDGVPSDRAVEFVRRGYRRRAVETPWQRRFVERFG
ncbi:protein-tyrosine phosphatase family protein [Blastococcus sp. SYSU DS1024]